MSETVEFKGLLPRTQWEKLDRDIFQNSTNLERLRTNAWAAGAGTISTLAIAIARINASVPIGVTLDSGYGGDAGFNIFTALVGGSGAGKGGALKSSRQSLLITGQDSHLVSVEQHGVASGEGIAALFAQQRERAVGTEPENPQLERALLVEEEVSSLGRRSERVGSTLQSTLLKLYSDENLAGITKGQRTHVEPGSYRAGFIVAVQPGNAGMILSGAASGFPQRFLWTEAGTNVPGAEEPPITSGPIPVKLPEFRDGVMACCEEIKAETLRHRLMRGNGHDLGAEAHTHLTTIRVAAGIALLREHTTVEADDWRRAQALMAYSRKVREACEKAALIEQARSISERNAVEDTAHQGQLAGLRAKIIDTLEGDRVPVGGAMTERQITRNWSRRQRENFRDAVEELIDPTGSDGGSPVRVTMVGEKDDKGEHVVKYKLAPA